LEVHLDVFRPRKILPPEMVELSLRNLLSKEASMELDHAFGRDFHTHTPIDPVAMIFTMDEKESKKIAVIVTLM